MHELTRQQNYFYVGIKNVSELTKPTTLVRFLVSVQLSEAHAYNNIAKIKSCKNLLLVSIECKKSVNPKEKKENRGLLIKLSLTVSPNHLIILFSFSSLSFFPNFPLFLKSYLYFFSFLFVLPELTTCLNNSCMIQTRTCKLEKRKAGVK